MGISLPPININPGSAGGSIAPQNPFADFVQALLGAQQVKNQKSLGSAQLDLRKQELALDIAREKTRQAEFAHQQEIAAQQGEAARLFLEHAMPHLAATGQLGTMLGTGGGNDAMNAALPVAQAGASPYQQYTQQMDPQAFGAFATQMLPRLQQMSGGGGQLQQAQTGDLVTSFSPDKGFFDPRSGQWVPSIERHQTPEQIAAKQTDQAIAQERLAAMKDYRVAVRSQVQTNQFRTMTKPLRERGSIIMQAIQTISDAQNNPDPNARKVLYSSAIANFVQAADQKAQLRYQLLQYFKNNVDPSVAGKWSVLKERILQGQLPGYVTQGMLAHLGNLLQMSRSEYEKQRAGEIKRHPELAGWLPEADEFFTSDLANQSPGAATGGDVIPPPP